MFLAAVNLLSCRPMPSIMICVKEAPSDVDEIVTFAACMPSVYVA